VPLLAGASGPEQKIIYIMCVCARSGQDSGHAVASVRFLSRTHAFLVARRQQMIMISASVRKKVKKASAEFDDNGQNILTRSTCTTLTKRASEILISLADHPCRIASYDCDDGLVRWARVNCKQQELSQGPAPSVPDSWFGTGWQTCSQHILL
jgi:hypothetical protein